MTLSRFRSGFSQEDLRMSKDMIESPLVYTRCRDLHAAGIILLQMLMGRDITSKFRDIHGALSAGTET